MNLYKITLEYDDHKECIYNVIGFEQEDNRMDIKYIVTTDYDVFGIEERYMDQNVDLNRTKSIFIELDRKVNLIKEDK